MMFVLGGGYYVFAFAVFFFGVLVFVGLVVGVVVLCECFVGGFLLGVGFGFVLRMWR